jgi:hypothetical protein
MTVSTQTSKSQYVGDGLVDTFVGAFPILDQTHITVTWTSPAGVDTTLVLNSQYTVQGVGNPTFIVVCNNAPGIGHIVTIARNVPFTQGLDLVLNDEFPSSEMERALDKLTMLVQQIYEATNRTLRTAATDTANLAILPPVAQRAQKYLAFDDNGAPIAAVNLPGSAIVSAFGTTLIDDPDAGTARSTLGLGSLSTKSSVATSDINDQAVTLGKISRTGAGANTILGSDGFQLLWVARGHRRFAQTSVLSQNPMAINATITGAHGLGQTPHDVLLEIECLTAELGYSIGDKIQLNRSTLYASGASHGLSVSWDATNVTVISANNTIASVPHKSTRSMTAITPANWKLNIIPIKWSLEA